MSNARYLGQLIITNSVVYVTLTMARWQRVQESIIITGLHIRKMTLTISVVAEEFISKRVCQYIADTRSPITQCVNVSGLCLLQVLAKVPFYSR